MGSPFSPKIHIFLLPGKSFYYSTSIFSHLSYLYSLNKLLDMCFYLQVVYVVQLGSNVGPVRSGPGPLTCSGQMTILYVVNC